MRSKKNSNLGYEIEPFYKRIPSNIGYWFSKKASNVKVRLTTYFKSKETWKIWKRRLIVVAVILVIIGSFKVKDALNLYPYDENSYLLTDLDRTTLTNYAGSPGVNRVDVLFENITNRTDDSIRMVSTVMGYKVTEDISYDSETGKITLVVDNRKNMMVSKADRVKKTVEYTGTKTKYTSDSKFQYYLTAVGQTDFLVAEVALKDAYNSGSVKK